MKTQELQIGDLYYFDSYKTKFIKSAFGTLEPERTYCYLGELHISEVPSLQPNFTDSLGNSLGITMKCLITPGRVTNKVPVFLNPEGKKEWFHDLTGLKRA